MPACVPPPRGNPSSGVGGGPNPLDVLGYSDSGLSCIQIESEAGKPGLCTHDAHNRSVNRHRIEGTVDDKQREHFTTHQVAVFSVSAGMVGACLTAISLIVVIKNLTIFRTWCDVIFVVDMLLFLGASLLSYIAFRLYFRGPWRFCHQTADVLILVGMALMVVTSCLLVWALI
jgi:hypothetical protein